MSDAIVENMRLIHAMNTIVDALNDADTTEELWYLTYPDGADEEDVFDMANDDEMMDQLCRTFVNTIRAAGDGGFYMDEANAVYGTSNGKEN